MRKSFIVLFVISFTFSAYASNKNYNILSLCIEFFYPNSSVYKNIVDLNCYDGHDQFSFKLTAENNNVLMVIDSSILNGTAIYDSLSQTYKKTITYNGFNYNYEYKLLASDIIQWVSISLTN